MIDELNNKHFEAFSDEELEQVSGGFDVAIPGVISTSGLDGLIPGDIESIDVLKEASSEAVYGSRAANGVIIVT